MENPKVIAITLNYNQNDYTLACINSILESDYSNFQIILIENGSSSENYQELLSKIPNDDRLIIERIEDNAGYVGGVNHGMKKALSYNPDYYLILNNDTLIDTKAIPALVETAENHNQNAIVSGKVYNYDEKDTLQYIGNTHDKGGILDYKAVVKDGREKDIGQYDQEMEMGMLDDIFWLVPSKIVEDLGYYSDYFFLYGEQADYALRAVKKGFKLIYTPHAKLWHKGSVTTGDGENWLKSPKIEYWGTMAVLKLAVLHFPEKEAKQFILKYALKGTIKKVLLFLRGKVKFNILRSHFLALKHFRFWNIVRYKDNGFNPFN